MPLADSLGPDSMRSGSPLFLVEKSFRGADFRCSSEIEQRGNQLKTRKD
jgi:hypothetical protein